MRVFIAGGSGFIGSHIASKLMERGHQVVAGVRSIEKAKRILPGAEFVRCDFTGDHHATVWVPRLKGVDVVINAVGIISEHGQNSFDALHTAAPKAMFEACVNAGVKRVIQISALGADEKAGSRYHLSKKAADDFLAGLDLDWTIIQPSVVYGPGSASMAMFLSMSALPIIPLVGDGGQRFQPIHIDDLAEGIARIITEPKASRIRIEAVGPEPVTFAEMLFAYREWLGLRKTVSLKTPIPLVRVGAWFGNFIKNSPMNSEALDMLLRGNTGDPKTFTGVTGIKPRPLSEALAANPAGKEERRHASLSFLLPVLQISTALVWIVSGVFPLFFYPLKKSYELLNQAGIAEALQPMTLYGSSILNILLGLSMLIGYRVRQAGIAQLTAMLSYTAIITVRMPELWVHPFGPVFKNIPIMAATMIIIALKED